MGGYRILLITSATLLALSGGAAADPFVEAHVLVETGVATPCVYVGVLEPDAVDAALDGSCRTAAFPGGDAFDMPILGEISFGLSYGGRSITCIVVNPEGPVVATCTPGELCEQLASRRCMVEPMMPDDD